MSSFRHLSTTPDAIWVENSASSAAPLAASGPCDLRLSPAPGLPWRGFGGCFNELGWRALRAASPADRDHLLADLFDPSAADGCRFTLGRLPIGANDYSDSWYSHDEYENDFALKHFSIERDRRALLPFIRAARALQPALDLFASPWSPPTWMKFPAACNYGTLRDDPRIHDAYARYFLRFVQAYRAEGLPLSAVHVQNEPNSDQKFPSCLWTGPQMRDFIRDHLGPVFAAASESCEIWAGTIEREDYDAWANTILSDESARRFVHGVGYQWAGKGAVQRTRQSWPALPILQTENECGDGQNTWAHAHHVFSLLHHYVTNGSNGYVYWNMMLEPGGLSTWGWRQNAMATVDPATGAITRNPEFHVMRHASRFVVPGAASLRAEGYWAANALGFQNPDGAPVVIVRNPLPTPRALTLHLPGTTTPAWTGVLPARSFNTLVGDTA